MRYSETNLDGFVPLGQAGIPEPEIRRQLKTLLHSTAFENKRNSKKLLEYLVNKAIAGHVPSQAEIARDVFGKKHLNRGDAQPRGETGKVRAFLAEHYASTEAQPGEIRFYIPPRQYGVFAPKRPSAEPLPLRRDSLPIAVITEPQNNVEVYQRVTVQGRIDVLNFDLRVWLVVRTPGGDLYPQCRVSRNNPEWEQEVRIGRLQWGSDEGAEYEINLVAADGDGDCAFHQYLKSNRDGFGPLLPSDVTVLDAKRVTRRDIRPNQPRANSA
jgi:hypothetical protein